MFETLKFAVTLLQKNLKMSAVRRVSFFVQAILMMAHNVLFFSIWWIFFYHFKDINGWTLSELTILYAIVVGAFGWAMVLAGGLKDLGKKISTGEIDSLMTQPKSVLLQILGSHSLPSGWGDILTAIFLIAISDYASWQHLPIIVLLTFTSTVLFIAAGVIIFSLAFWVGHMDSLGHQLFEFVLTFSAYPQSMFTGYTKYLLFTLLPAGFIGYFPVQIMQNFDAGKLAMVLGSAVGYSLLAHFVFKMGIRRYQRA